MLRISGLELKLLLKVRHTLKWESWSSETLKIPATHRVDGVLLAHVQSKTASFGVHWNAESKKVWEKTFPVHFQTPRERHTCTRFFVCAFLKPFTSTRGSLGRSHAGSKLLTTNPLLSVLTNHLIRSLSRLSSESLPFNQIIIKLFEIKFVNRVT